MNRPLSVALTVTLCVGVPFALARPAENRSPAEDRFVQPVFVPTPPPWIAAKKAGGIAYLLFGFPPTLQRYDMSARAWLPEISFLTTPTAFEVGPDALYVAFRETVKRFDLEGGSETQLTVAPFSVSELVLTSGGLVLAAERTLLSISPVTGALIDSREYFTRMTGFSLAPSGDRLFARWLGVSPADIVHVDVAPDGTLGAQVNSPYHGELPGAVQTFSLPDGTGVADNAGIVYDRDLVYIGSLAGSFDHADFFGGGAVVLRGRTLVLHDAGFLERGRFELSVDARSLFVHDGSVFAFSSGANGADVVETPLSSLVPPEPGPPIDPNGLAFVPDEIRLGSDDVVYLLSRSYRSVFRWSAAARSFLPSVPLAEAPSQLAIATSGDALYLTYANGAIRRIALPSGVPQPEEPFANTVTSACGLGAVGAFVFVCDNSFRTAHWTFDTAGVLRDRNDRVFTLPDSFEWSMATSRLYFFSSLSPRDLYWESIDSSGVITGLMDSPLHSSVGMIPPIRADPQGLIVLLGSGRYHDAITLAPIAELGSTLTDATWLSDQLVTMHDVGGDTELRFWNRFLAIVLYSRNVQGAPLRLFRLGEDLLAVTLVAGVPEFVVIESPLFRDGFESGDLAAWDEAVGGSP